MLDALIRLRRSSVPSTAVDTDNDTLHLDIICVARKDVDEPLVTLRPAIVAPPSDHLYSITGTSGSRRLPLSPSRYRGGGAKVIDREIYRNVFNWWQGDAPPSPLSGIRQR